MKFRSLWLALLLVACRLYSFGQSTGEALYKSYNWEALPAIHAVRDVDKSYPAVILKHHQIMEMKIIAGAPVTFSTEHKIVHVNNDAGIESYNKVAIPTQGRELVTLKVRSIAPDGKVTQFNNDNLKELSNVEGYGRFKIFAIEGVAVGGELEYLYTLRSGPQMYGREILQGDVPVMDSRLVICYPEKFVYTAKCYNGLPTPYEDEMDGRRRALTIESTNIPALKEEPYSAHQASLMRVDYKLESNGYMSGMMSWENLSKSILNSLHDMKGGEGEKLSRMLDALRLDGKSNLDKVLSLEQYVKTNFTIKAGGDEAYDALRDVLAKRVGSEQGLAKVYLSCLAKLGIEAEVVMTTNRFRGRLDSFYSTPVSFSEILFYFPEFDKYLTPGVPFMRLGSPPDHIAGGNGLFVSYKAMPLKIVYKSHAIRNIEPLDYTHNNLGVKATLRFTGAMEPQVTQENFWQGYRAFESRGFYAYAPADKKDDFLNGATLSSMENFTILKREIEGQDINLSADPDNYFRVKTLYVAPSIVEKAGDDYLVSVGKLIGKQSELYQEKERRTDIAFSSISNYNHELIMEIPKGYSCTGLEAIATNAKLKVDNKVVMKFESVYEIKDNILIIKVQELYTALYLPKGEYNAFRSVVNSAADFNKLVVVLSPSE
ncbi:MAG TPA: DUF3857 domain-containing protein [Ohtaekwangia sp.]|nr:DUF3857 domain-containing protein [Ohtaekwangia sp.]